MLLRFSLGLAHQPCRAEQGIARHKRDAREEAKWAQPVEPATRLGVVLDTNALKDGAERDPLREDCDHRTCCDGTHPSRDMVGIPPQTFKGTATQDPTEIE